MISPKISLLLTGLALAVSLALAADWLAAEWFAVGSPLVRAAILSISLALGGTWLLLQWHREPWKLGAPLACVDRLGHTNVNELARLEVDSALRKVLPRKWFKAIRRLTKRLSALARRIDDLQRERTELEGRVRRYEAQTQRIQSILSALGEPVLVIDKRDQLVLTNSSANSLFAIDSNRAAQRKVDTLIESERLVDLLVNTRRCRQFTERSCEIAICDAEGKQHWYRVTARNIPTQPGQSDPDGTSQGVVALLHDISAQKIIQKRNAELVSAVSHAMKTPLAGIKAYLELLADGDADDEAAAQQFLEIIAAEGDRLQHLVDDLVELAGVEADLAGATKQLLSLRELAEEAARDIRPQVEACCLHLETDLAGVDACVLVDRRMIVRAAGHLLSNAVEFTPEGGRIRLRTFTLGSEVGFEVEDTGVGMSADDCQKVFEKFYRVPKPSEAAAGTGLGLALVKHVIEDVHAGRIEVYSTLGKGSTFRVFLPRAAAEAWPSGSPRSGRREPQETQ